MAAAAEQPFGPGPFAHMAASSFVYVSTYIFLTLPCPAGKGPPARPLGVASTDLDPDAAARSVIIAEKAAPRAHGNGMLRNRSHAHIVVLLAALALFAGCATLGPSQQQAGEGPHARSAIEHVRAANAALQRGDAHAALKQLAAVPPYAPPELRQQAHGLQRSDQLSHR